MKRHQQEDKPGKIHNSSVSCRLLIPAAPPLFMAKEELQIVIPYKNNQIINQMGIDDASVNHPSNLRLYVFK